jgi:hypothetical protein
MGRREGLKSQGTLGEAASHSEEVGDLTQMLMPGVLTDTCVSLLHQGLFALQQLNKALVTEVGGLYRTV